MRKTAIIFVAIFIACGCFTNERAFDTMSGSGMLIAVKTSAMEKPHYAWDICLRPVLLPDGRPMPAPAPTPEQIAAKKPIFPFVCAQEEFIAVDSNGSVVATVLGPLKDVVNDLNLTVPVTAVH